jgi:hypothetical protein
MTEETKPNEESEEQVKQAPKTPDKDAGRANKNMRVGKRRTLRDKWRLTSLPNKTISVATVVIAGASLLQFGTAVLQWREMSDAGKQTDKIISSDERLATAMENSVAQAKTGLDASIEASRIDQRAWVGPTGEVILDIKPWKQPQITTVVSNTGKTPALHVRALIVGKIGLKGTAMMFDYAKLPSGQNRSDTTLQPGTHITLYPENTPVFSPTQIETIKRGDIVVYVHGKITYQDVFGKEHHTTFCSIVDRNLTDAEDCPQYNHAD